MPAFRLLVSRCLRLVRDPTPEELRAVAGAADPKDLPILAAAAREDCAFLATFNLRHFRPGLTDVSVLTPGDLVLRVRYLLSNLKSSD